MPFARTIFLAVLLASSALVYGQESGDINASSATDANVRIDKKKRWGTSTAPKDRVMYNSASRKKFVDTRERTPKVTTMGKRQQKRNNRMRLERK